MPIMVTLTVEFPDAADQSDLARRVETICLQALEAAGLDPVSAGTVAWRRGDRPPGESVR